jgi:hypothetical protein
MINIKIDCQPLEDGHTEIYCRLTDSVCAVCFQWRLADLLFTVAAAAASGDWGWERAGHCGSSLVLVGWLWLSLQQAARAQPHSDSRKRERVREGEREGL